MAERLDPGVDQLDEPEAPEGSSSEDTDSELPPKRRGFILDEENKTKVAKHIVKMREDQEPLRSRNRATWKRNRWWREGKRFVRLEKKENAQAWEAKLPLGMGSSPPVPNKTDRLCRRLVNTIMVDPPYPECEPGDASSEARDAAEFATRYLSVKGSPSELNMEQICRTSMDKSMTFASTFGWVITDPTAGGHRPRQITAHPLAQTEEDALVDPETGGAAPKQTLKERYMREDGALTDKPEEADLQWLPGPRVRLLTGLNVDLLPPTAHHVREAVGVLIADVTTLGDLRETFPEVLEAMSKEQLEKLCKYRPDNFKDLLPAYADEPEDQREGEGWKDSQTIVTVTCYYRRCAEYPFGAYAIVGGDSLLIHRDEWTALMPQTPAEDGTERPDKKEVLEIPVAQLRCLDDTTSDNPYGIAMAEQLGPADEVRASALGYEMEYMFRFGNPQAYIPMGSIVQPKQLLQRDGTPIMTNPNGDPFYEPVPPLPATVPGLRDEMGHDMDDEVGLQQAAQGVEDPSVKSGIHARVVVQEALKAVGHVRSNTAFFYIDLNRILLEQARAFTDVPQLLSYVGEDGQYKEKEWSRTSFRQTKSVTIARGSFTMHTLLAKQEMANEMLDRQAITQEDYLELTAGGVSPVLGMQENPHLMRVRRQLEDFQAGPPEGWEEAFALFQQGQMAMQQYSMVMQEYQSRSQPAIPGGPVPPEGVAGTGEILGPPPQQPEAPPKPPGPFDDHLPVDLEPIAAKIRHRQLSREMAAHRFKSFIPAWQQELIAEYTVMANAAGVVTVPAMQAAQQQGALPGAGQQAGQGAPAPQGQQQGAGGAPVAQPGGPAIGPNGEPLLPPASSVPQLPNLNIMMPDVEKEIIHERDARGAIVRSRVVPIGTQAMVQGLPS